MNHDAKTQIGSDKLVVYPRCLNYMYKPEGYECDEVMCQICVTRAVDAYFKAKEEDYKWM